MNTKERLEHIKKKINEAWDDPRDSRAADEVFAKIIRNPKTLSWRKPEPSQQLGKSFQVRSGFHRNDT